jgi:hypothetical protein
MSRNWPKNVRAYCNSFRRHIRMYLAVSDADTIPCQVENSQQSLRPVIELPSMDLNIVSSDWNGKKLE